MFESKDKALHLSEMLPQQKCSKTVALQAKFCKCIQLSYAIHKLPIWVKSLEGETYS